MPQHYRTPGVYVQEISTLPPSVAEVSTAVPGFVGVTEIQVDGPLRINSLLDFETHFGGPKKVAFEVNGTDVVHSGGGDKPDFSLHDCLNIYFQNGGGPCYVVSAGTFDSEEPASEKPDFSKALEALARARWPATITSGATYRCAGCSTRSRSRRARPPHLPSSNRIMRRRGSRSKR